MLLSDGTEPGPVYCDVGSGPDVPSSTEWHAYGGRRGRPRAVLLRGSCSCGWRGSAEYRLDWGRLARDQPLYEADIDLSGPIGDYEAHVWWSGTRPSRSPQSSPVSSLSSSGNSMSSLSTNRWSY
ncbi:hypothetical protein [Streptomyces vinaceus]|uniref:hypothetical protein n=1 Tax=Streptomyces vinaceus TaxID=1960 RepID=UPI0036B075DE